MLPWGDEVCESLELVSGHGSVATLFQGQILLKMSIKVLFEGQVAHEAHAADAAVEFDAVKYFSLGRLVEPYMMMSNSINHLLVTN